MKNFFSGLLLFFFIIAISSCEKLVCEKNQTAFLVITNKTLNPVQFYFDGVYMYDMLSLTKETLEVAIGAHVIGGKPHGSNHLDTLTWEKPQSFSVCETVEYSFQ